MYKVGPLLVVNGVITPVTHLFSAIYRGPITPLIISGDGAHPVGNSTENKNMDKPTEPGTRF